MTRSDIVDQARAWLGIRYRHKGRSTAGLDCIGLLVVVGRALNVPHEDRQDYADYPGQDRVILAVLDRYLTLAAPTDQWAGSIGVFSDARLPCHCGIFSTKHGSTHLIHAMLRRRVVLEEPWATSDFRLIRRYEFPGVVA